MANPADCRLEVMQSDYSWLDIFGSVNSITNANKTGLSVDPASLPSYPAVGGLTVGLKNLDGLYTPAANGISTGTIDNNRRVRIRYAGSNNGKALQVLLNGSSGVGGTLSIGAGLTDNTTGFSTGVNTNYAQTVKVSSGVLSQITIVFNQNATTALNTTSYTWQVCADGGTVPGAVLATGTGTISSSAGNQTSTITVSSGPYLNANTTYWIVISSPVGGSGGTLLYYSNASIYANGDFYFDNFSGSGVWTPWPGPRDVEQWTITTTADTVYTSQVVTTATSIGNVWTLQFEARAQFDSQYNRDSVNIVTSGETGASTIYLYTNKWATYSLTFTATATGTTIEPRFSPQFHGTNLNSQAFEYRNITLKKGAGSNVLTNGDLSSGALSPWAVHNAGGTTLAATVINDYFIVFNGKIQDIYPAAQLSSINPLTTMDVVDSVQQVKAQLGTIPLQKSFTCDSIADLALALLPSGTLHTTLPGTVTDPGRSIFPIGGDTWVTNRTSVLQIINQGVLSELGGRCWADRDGTFEVHNRDYVPLRAGSTPKLTLADGVSGSYQLSLVRSMKKVRNDIVVTSHQRVTSAAAGTIGKMDQQTVFIPGNGSVDIILTFKDATGNTIGADSLIDLTPTTDYLVNYYAANDPNYNVSAHDLTTSQYLKVTTKVTASQMVVTFASLSSAFAGWVNFLQVRGLTVTQYNPATVEVSDATSMALYDKQTFAVDLPFQVDQQLITNYANYLLTQFKYPFIEANWFECQNTTIVNGVDVMSLEIGDPVSVSDTRSGLSSVIHMVTNLEYDWDPLGGNSAPVRVRVYLERMDQVKYWQLGVSGFSELGVTTTLYI